jgi:hypothetical protein
MLGMRRGRTLLPFTVFLLLALHETRNGAIHSPADGLPPDRKAAFGALPLYFEANRGQADARVNYLSRAGEYTLYLTAGEAVLALESPRPTSLRLRLEGANPRPRVAGVEELPGKVSYLLGSDPAEWRTDVPTYARVKYRDVYPGVDLVYYGNPREIEYDFIVAPGADPGCIALAFEGADRMELDGDGNLVLHTAAGEVVQRAPRIYQEIDGARRSIPGGYVIRETPHPQQSAPRVTFHVGEYDPRHPLVIDPVLVYSTYLGGEGSDVGFDIAVDAAGAIYLSGQTTSLKFPTTGALQPVSGGGSQDGYVAKLSPDGARLEYVTYLGGSGFDRPRGLAVDAAGDAYVVGHTDSRSFPAVNAYQSVLRGSQDGFVTKLDATGSRLIYSTYLGGTHLDQCLDIALIAGGVCVTGQTYSINFPIVRAQQPTLRGDGDAFITRLDASGTAIVYSTYLGGRRLELGEGIAADAQGNAYVTGRTLSLNFPTLNALQPVKGDQSISLNDAFVAKIGPLGAFVYSTHLGGSGEDIGWRIAVDATGNVYVNGRTSSSRDFPLVNAAQSLYGGGSSDAFVLKLDATGRRLLYSTYLGGSAEENPVATGIAVDNSGNAYVVGSTSSSDFPTVNAVQPVYGGDRDGFLARLNTAGSAWIYSTYLGGPRGDNTGDVAVDLMGNACVVANTVSPGLATTNAVQPGLVGGGDALVMKIVGVTLDIRPGVSPNSINLRSTDLLPVAILSNASFNAVTLDVATVTLGDPRLGKAAAPNRDALRDLDSDGARDRLLFFSIPDLVGSGALDAGSTQLVLRGRTGVGGLVVADDVVSVVP